MRTRWDLGDSVRVVRNVRNDGTYPGAELGALLIRCGSTGTVIDVGTFLMDQIIYTVHFLEVDRIVGCREEDRGGFRSDFYGSLLKFMGGLEFSGAARCARFSQPVAEFAGDGRAKSLHWCPGVGLSSKLNPVFLWKMSRIAGV